MAAAGSRKQLVAVVALVVAVMLLVAGAAAQDCGVPGGTMAACLSYCRNGRDADACCTPLKSANMDCLCNYWQEYKSKPYFAGCGEKIKSACGIQKC